VCGSGVNLAGVACRFLRPQPALARHPLPRESGFEGLWRLKASVKPTSLEGELESSRL